MVYDILSDFREDIPEMKRIELRMNEQEKYEVIKSLVDHNGNKHAAAVKLGCTVRTVNRLIQRYKKEGLINGIPSETISLSFG